MRDWFNSPSMDFRGLIMRCLSSQHSNLQGIKKMEHFGQPDAATGLDRHHVLTQNLAVMANISLRVCEMDDCSQFTISLAFAFHLAAEPEG